MLFLRLLPLFVPFLVWVFDEIYFFFPKLFFVVLVFIVLTLFFAVWRLSVASTMSKDWWNYLILPVIFSIAIPAYSSFLPNKVFIQFLFIINSFILYFYFRSIYYYQLNPEKYKTFSIENISSFVGLFSFFLVASTTYALQSFSILSVALSFVGLFLFVITIIYQRIWADKILFSVGLRYLLINCLILLELAWAISFLPINYNIGGVVLTIFYYIIIDLTKHYLSDKLSKQIVKFYLLFAFVSLVVIFVTANWL
jgi:hypothetical protein